MFRKGMTCTSACCRLDETTCVSERRCRGLMDTDWEGLIQRELYDLKVALRKSEKERESKREDLSRKKEEAELLQTKVKKTEGERESLQKKLKNTEGERESLEKKLKKTEGERVVGEETEEKGGGSPISEKGFM